MYGRNTGNRHRVAISVVLTAATLIAACSDEDSPDRATPAAAEATESPSTAATSAPSATVAPTEQASLTTEAAPTPPLPPRLPDDELAASALLPADDLGEDWEALGPEFAFPNGAELARMVAECEQFAELVFEGGEQHGTGASASFARGDELVFTYVAVFPNVEQASAMLDAIGSPAFDECWARFNDVAVTALPYGIESGSYVAQEPPELSITAHASSVKFLDGSIVIAGNAIPDTCVCAFAQVGRGIVEVHSAAPVFDPELRTQVVQAAVDRLQTTLGAPALDTDGLLDAIGSTEADIGTGVNYVADQVGRGQYDAAYRRRQDAIDACSSIERPLMHGATRQESIDGRGWLYVDLESPQLPYVAHAVMILADEATAMGVMDDLSASTELPSCIAEWVADVNGDDPASRNAPWRTSALEYTASDAAFAEPLDALGDDQLVVTWRQHLTIDGAETPSEQMSYVMARLGAAIFTFSGNDPDRTAAAAELLADRTRQAMS